MVVASLANSPGGMFVDVVVTVLTERRGLRRRNLRRAPIASYPLRSSMRSPCRDREPQPV